MAIRMTGMYSNLDTDAIISQLMKAQRTKVDAIEKKKTKLEWKTEAWSTINSKLYSLYTGTLSNLKYSDGYSAKKSTISSPNVATITAGDSAVEGAQELAVKQLAKPGYLTGAEVSSSDGKALSLNSSISQLTGYTEGTTGKIEVKVGSKDAVSIELNGDMKIGQVIEKLRQAGVSANFDATNNRFFINSTKSGAEADFTITSSDANGANILGSLGLDVNAGATKIQGQDAQIILNNAVFTSSSNTFSINGLNIVAQEVTGTTTDESGNTVYNTVSISTARNYEAVYDTIKNFLTKYNEIIKEMDGMYNAKSAKGYEPLTDEEKDAMTDDQVEKWEEKIKDAVLRRDSTLDGVTSVMKSAMSQVIEIDGKKYSLSSFGIDTGSYFETDADERGVYHIAGNKDDETVMNKADKLLNAITSDPETVVSFFTSLTKGLYSSLSGKFKYIEGVKSSDKVYEDKLMEEQVSDYEDEIKKLEKKFTAMEDRYYAQFSAMETALAKLQSNSSALTGLLGSQS